MQPESKTITNLMENLGYLNQSVPPCPDGRPSSPPPEKPPEEYCFRDLFQHTAENYRFRPLLNSLSGILMHTKGDQTRALLAAGLSVLEQMRGGWTQIPEADTYFINRYSEAILTGLTPILVSVTPGHTIRPEDTQPVLSAIDTAVRTQGQTPVPEHIWKPLQKTAFVHNIYKYLPMARDIAEGKRHVLLDNTLTDPLTLRGIRIWARNKKVVMAGVGGNFFGDDGEINPAIRETLEAIDRAGYSFVLYTDEQDICQRRIMDLEPDRTHPQIFPFIRMSLYSINFPRFENKHGPLRRFVYDTNILPEEYMAHPEKLKSQVIPGLFPACVWLRIPGMDPESAHALPETYHTINLRPFNKRFSPGPAFTPDIVRRIDRAYDSIIRLNL